MAVEFDDEPESAALEAARQRETDLAVWVVLSAPVGLVLGAGAGYAAFLAFGRVGPAVGLGVLGLLAVVGIPVWAARWFAGWWPTMFAPDDGESGGR